MVWCGREELYSHSTSLLLASPPLPFPVSAHRESFPIPSVIVVGLSYYWPYHRVYQEQTRRALMGSSNAWKAMDSA